MSVPAVIFDDIELWAAGYLKAALDARPEDYTADVFVSNEIPKKADGTPERRDRMVIIRRDGGPRVEQVFDLPRIGVDCWATTKQDAVDLARMVSALLWAAPGDSNVKTVQQTAGPIRIPDPSGQPRVYTTFEIKTKGTDLA